MHLEFPRRNPGKPFPVPGKPISGLGELSLCSGSLSPSPRALSPLPRELSPLNGVNSLFFGEVLPLFGDLFPVIVLHFPQPGNHLLLSRGLFPFAREESLWYGELSPSLPSASTPAPLRRQLPSHHVRSTARFCPDITSAPSPRAHPPRPLLHHTMDHSPGTP